MRDRLLVFCSAGLRAAAVGLTGVMLSLYLSTLQFDVAAVGLVITLGLAGCAAGTLAATLLADRFGRRATLITLSLLMAAAGGIWASSTSHALIIASAFLGMINGMGRDRGAGLTVEQAILPATTSPAQRTSIFAWYNVVVDVGHAVGSLLSSLPAFLRTNGNMTPLASYQATWWVYTVLCLLAALCALLLSSQIEQKTAQNPPPLSPESKQIIRRFAALSGMDSFGGGFLTTALVSYWFFRRFGVDESLLGPLFFVVRLLNGVSHLAAARIAKRIGLVKTMVFTHLPSSLLLMTVPFAPNLTIAITLFLIRESLVEMDVPTRQSYIMAVVKEEERVRAAGISNLARGVAWAVAPVIGGILMRHALLSTPFLIGSGLKVVYDLLLYRAFRGITPPEEIKKVPNTKAG